METYSYLDYKQMLDTVFLKYAAKTATMRLCAGTTPIAFTYGEFKTSADRLEKQLVHVGAQRADRIAVIADHSVFSVLAALSLTYLGYTAVMLDAALPDYELSRLIAHADISAVFTTEKIYKELALTSMPCFGICAKENTYSLFTGAAPKFAKTAKIPTDEDVIAIIFSSGTTGSMKGVEITYTSIINAYKCMVEYTNLRHNISFFNVLPISHIAGFSTAISCFLIGAEQGFVPNVSAKYLSKGFLEYNPTNFIMIPKVYEIIQEKILAKIQKRPLINIYYRIATHLSRFFRRYTGIKLKPLFRPIVSAALGKNMAICGCGTAPCPEKLAEFYLNLGIDFVNVYGSTETGFPISAANCKTNFYPTHGAGNIYQFPDIKIEIDKPDAKGCGEILVKTPLIMKGYFNDSELTQSAFDERGYFKTGDLGYVDAHDRLHITGRAKEAILLQNGNKAAPGDVDRYYQPVCPPGCLVASCGIPVPENGYEEIHLFIEAGQLSDIGRDKLHEALLERSKEAGSIYQIKGIHFVDSIPMTSVGKIKRYQLRSIATPKKDKKTQPNQSANTVLKSILDIIEECGRLVSVRPSDRLKEDLGLDSLTVVEVCAKIEDIHGVFIGERLDQLKTPEDIASYIETGVLKGSLGGQSKYSVEDFPIKRKMRHRAAFRMMMFLLRSAYNMKVEGVENVPINGGYILCPNHQTHLDSMFVWSALRNRRPHIHKISCLAADYLLKTSTLKFGLITLGGIPTDRTGNSAPSVRRMKQCLQQEGSCALIHPEGTRTRNGELGEFKNGAAKLSIESERQIIPVCIDGGYDIFPPQRKHPRLFDWKHFKRLPIYIRFGVAIEPDGKNAEEITNEIKRQIVEMQCNNRSSK